MKRVCRLDLELGRNDLRIERGCGVGRCACLGSCLDVIGTVNREDYLRFIRVFKPTAKQIDHYLSLSKLK